MQKIAAVGPRDTVLAFRALGLHAASVESPEEASRELFRLAEDGYAVIFIDEGIAANIEETIARYRTSALPAIIPIPGATGATGLGMAAVRKNVEKAVGADILFKEEG